MSKEGSVPVKSNVYFFNIQHWKTYFRGRNGGSEIKKKVFFIIKNGKKNFKRRKQGCEIKNIFYKMS